MVYDMVKQNQKQREARKMATKKKYYSNYEMEPIKKVKDEKGRILTYKVNKLGIDFEFNTLRKARIFALKIR